LHYGGIYKKVIKELIEKFNVHFVFADRWNSIALLDLCASDFTKRKLISKQYSVRYNDFLATRSYIEEQKLILPKIEMPFEKLNQVENYPTGFEGKPAAHLLHQLGTVRDMGSTVIKGSIYTDDLFRALVLGVSRLLDPKIAEELATRNAATGRGKMVGAVATGMLSTMMSGRQLGHPGQMKHTALLAYGGQADLLRNQKTSRTTHVVRINRLGN
jgi:hypothetical protein